MFQAISTAAPAVPATHVVFPCSWKRPLILPLRSTKTFKPLSCLKLNGANGYGRMNEFHEIELRVRDYELDQFGFVNNAILANYCQHGRHEFMKSIGLDFDELSHSGEALAIPELTIKIFAPLRTGNKFVIKTRISGTSVVRLYFEQFILKLPNQELILEAKGSGVWLDNKYRPVRVSSRFPSIRQPPLQNGVV